MDITSLKILFQTHFLTVVILILAGLSIRGSMVLLGQRWAKTFTHTYTLVLLPIITFVVSKVISGDLALSLGMVGALSIVRFRNPVKSPLELTAYFACITLGISATVSTDWLILQVAFLALAVFFVMMFKIIFQGITKRQFYDLSFSQGAEASVLELESSSQINGIRESKYFVSYNRNSDIYHYVMASQDIEILNEIAKQYESNPSVTRLVLRKQ